MPKAGSSPGLSDGIKGTLAGLPLYSAPASQEPHSCCPKHFITYFRSYTADALGQVFLSGILDIRPFRRVHIEITQFPTKIAGLTAHVIMGKISGQTLAQEIDTFVLQPNQAGAVIRSYEVKGPDFSIVLDGAPANKLVGIEGWIFLN